jgi:hypothetical protein
MRGEAAQRPRAARRFSTAQSSPRGQRRLQGLVRLITHEETEAGLRARLKALPPAARAQLLHVLMLPDSERADRS